MEYEVLFRGKRMDNGEWIEGYYVLGESDNLSYIIPKNNSYESVKPVIDETVGQYTGLTDKNGVKIFKGDILHVVTPNNRGNFQVKFAYGQFYIGCSMPIAYVRHSCEVRGNIHDNLELLEVRYETD